MRLLSFKIAKTTCLRLRFPGVGAVIFLQLAPGSDVLGKKGTSNVPSQSALPSPRGRDCRYASFPNVHTVCLGLLPVSCEGTVQGYSHACSPQTALGLLTPGSKHENSLYISFSHNDFPKCAEQQRALKQPVSSSLSKPPP